MHVFELYIYDYTVSSSYLLMFGDDRVIHYTRAYDVAGGASEV